jgi:SAM-dependent methyltransferase
MLDATLDRYRPRRTLILTSEPERLGGIRAYPVSSLFTVYSTDVRGPGDGSGEGRLARSVVCDPESLPFQSDAFDLVVAHGMLSDGDEALIAGIRRVMRGGGHLLVLGAGRWGSRNIHRWEPRPPAVRPFRICRRLRDRSFVIEDCAGYGLARLSLRSGNGASRLLVGVSDQVMVRARLSKARPIAMASRFRKPRAVGAQSVARQALAERRSRAGDREAVA